MPPVLALCEADADGVAELVVEVLAEGLSSATANGACSAVNEVMRNNIKSTTANKELCDIRLCCL
jgi:hypothetical protein